MKELLICIVAMVVYVLFFVCIWADVKEIIEWFFEKEGVDTYEEDDW